MRQHTTTHIHAVNRAEVRVDQVANVPFVTVRLFEDEYPAGITMYFGTSEAAQNLADQFGSAARMLREVGV